jgi:predicted metal-binding protein
MMTDLVQAALDFGFSHAGALDPATARVRHEVRAMCAADRCGMYNRNWTCPPATGTLAAHQRILASYRSGLIVQTTATLEDEFDYDTMLAAGVTQQRLVEGFRDQLRPTYPDLLALGNGACAVCPTCTYPGAPCAYPHRAIQSMEAFGLVVSDLCAANGVGYHYGPGTLTYTGCYLLEKVSAVP